MDSYGDCARTNGKAPECQEYCRVVEGWAEGERLMAARVPAKGHAAAGGGKTSAAGDGKKKKSAKKSA
jgi:hypothetical protein